MKVGMNHSALKFLITTCFENMLGKDSSGPLHMQRQEEKQPGILRDGQQCHKPEKGERVYVREG